MLLPVIGMCGFVVVVDGGTVDVVVDGGPVVLVVDEDEVVVDDDDVVVEGGTVVVDGGSVVDVVDVVLVVDVLVVVVVVGGHVVVVVGHCSHADADAAETNNMTKTTAINATSFRTAVPFLEEWRWRESNPRPRSRWR